MEFLDGVENLVDCRAAHSLGSITRAFGSLAELPLATSKGLDNKSIASGLQSSFGYCHSLESSVLLVRILDKSVLVPLFR